MVLNQYQGNAGSVQYGHERWRDFGLINAGYIGGIMDFG
jgi:hypothetical protein